MQRVLCAIVGLLLLASTIPACRQPSEGDWKQVASADISEGKVVVKSAAGDLKEGKNDIRIEFVDAGGNLLPVEHAEASAAMPMPGMSPMTTSMELKSTAEEPGRFTAQANFEMRGGWQCSIQYRLKTGASGSAAFNLNVR
ncbi:MAG: FixH family protein [Acidobacteriota bacterium]